MRHFRPERGSSLVEYALVVMLVAAIAIGGVAVVGAETSAAYESVGTGLRGEAAQSSATTSVTLSATSSTTSQAPTTTATTAATPPPTTQAPTTVTTQASLTSVTATTITTTQPLPGACSGSKPKLPPDCR